MFTFFSFVALCTSFILQYTTKNINELTDTTYEAILNEPDKIKLVKFYMPTCGHCMQLKPTFEAISNKLKKYITSYTYNISTHGALASKLGIDSAPRTFVFKSLSDYKEINTRDKTQIINIVYNFYDAKFKAISLKKFSLNTKERKFFYFYIGSTIPPHILDFLFKEKKNKVEIYRLKKAPKYLKQLNMKQTGLFSFNEGKINRFNNEQTDKAKYLNNFKWRSERGYNNFIIIKENSCRNKFINTLTGTADVKRNKNEIIYILIVNNTNKKSAKRLLKEYNNIINSFHVTKQINTKLKRYFVLDLYNNGNNNLLNKLKKITYGQTPPLLITINKETSKVKPLFLSKIQNIESISKYIMDEFNSVEDDKSSYKFSLSSFDLKSMRFMNNTGSCSDKTLNKFRELSDKDLKKHSYTYAPLLVININFNKYLSSDLSDINSLMENLEELPNYIINIKNYTFNNGPNSLSITFKQETKQIDIGEGELSQSKIDNIIKQVKSFIVDKLNDIENIPQYINGKEDDKKALQKAISESGNKNKIIIMNKKFNKKQINKLKILQEVLKDNFALFIADKTTIPDLNFPPNLKLLKKKKMEFILLLAPPADNEDKDDNESERIVKFDSYYYNDTFDFRKIISFINSKRINFDLELLIKEYRPLKFNMISDEQDLISNCENAVCLIKILHENNDFNDLIEINNNIQNNDLFIIWKDNLSSFNKETWANEKGLILYISGKWKLIEGDIDEKDLEHKIEEMTGKSEHEDNKKEFGKEEL